MTNPAFAPFGDAIAILRVGDRNRRTCHVNAGWNTARSLSSSARVLPDRLPARAHAPLARVRSAISS